MEIQLHGSGVSDKYLSAFLLHGDAERGEEERKRGRNCPHKTQQQIGGGGEVGVAERTRKLEGADQVRDRGDRGS